ncbi:MAG: response regulator, partial [Pseudohongiellaceae bacterium]
MTRNLQFLLVEDDPSLSRLIIDELESEGWKVCAHDSLETAELWLAENTPALIITDLRLPDGNGMDLVSKAVPRFPEEK